MPVRFICDTCEEEAKTVSCRPWEGLEAETVDRDLGRISFDFFVKDDYTIGVECRLCVEKRRRASK